MFEQILSISLVLFCHVFQPATLSSSIQMCISVIKIACIPCTNQQLTRFRCGDEKIIHFSGRHGKIDYESYVNSNIKIIEDDLQLTLYSCNLHDGYIHVSKSTYYPTDRELEYPPLYDVSREIHDRWPFQQCLTAHCAGNTNYFECKIKLTDDFDFGFDDVVTPKCVQNITMAYISAPVLTHLDFSQFFKYAHNLIYLRLSFHKLRYFECRVFQSLFNLRLLDFKFNNFPLKHYTCILRHNVNLVRIQTADLTIWNNCEESSINSSNISITTVNTKTLSSEKPLIYLTTIVYSRTATTYVGLLGNATPTTYTWLFSLLFLPVMLLIVFYGYKKQWIPILYRSVRERYNL